MTFTRLSDDSTLTPDSVEEFAQKRPAGANARRVAQSSEVRATFTGAVAAREGHFTLRFNTYADALAAQAWFSAPSRFEFDGTTTDTTDYAIVGGYIVETADTTAGEFATTFVVNDTVELDRLGGSWQIRAPYMEVPE